MPSSKESDKQHTTGAAPEAKESSPPRPRPLPLSIEKPGA